MKGNFHVRFLGECGRGNPPALTRLNLWTFLPVSVSCHGAGEGLLMARGQRVVLCDEESEETAGLLFCVVRKTRV